MKSLFKLTAESILLSILLCSCTATANTIDQSQKNWYNRYKNQPNVPKPKDMQLNTDKEPKLDGEGFISLYNGKDLTGWEALQGTCTFEAKGETIVGTCVKGSPSTYLSTKKRDYTDFIFTCDMMFEVEGNSGVMFRAIFDDDAKPNSKVIGPQAEMEPPSQGRGWSGGIYGQDCGGYYYPNWLEAHKEARGALKGVGEWNRLTIMAKGDVVKTWLNGIPVAHWKTNGVYPKGYFGLQIHKGAKGIVHWKNIRIKEL